MANNDPFEMKQLTALNRAWREQRVRQLRRSICSHSYRIDAQLVAKGMLREAAIDAAALHIED